MNWNGRSAFVTGATGMVGSWLVRDLIARGCRVVCLVRDWDPQSDLIRSGAIAATTVVEGRLEDVGTLERALCDHEVEVVFHLAAQAIVGTAVRNPLATFESNVRGTWNVLEACRRHAARIHSIVAASSDKAYGDAAVLPYTEEMPVAGVYPYDASKSCADLVAASYAKTYGMPVVVSRCGNIYGGGDLNWSRIVPGTIRSLLRGERPVIRSDGRFTRDYVYVEDVVDGYIRLAERGADADVRGRAYNLSCERPFTVLEITDAIRRLMGREDLEPVILDEVRTEIRDQYLDSTLAREQLGWRPRHSLDAGLQKTIAWYRACLGAETGRPPAGR